MKMSFPVNIAPDPEEEQEIIHCDVDLDKPVLHLKNLLKEKTGVEVKHQQLVYNGWELEDDNRLGLYRLVKDYRRGPILLISKAARRPIANDSRLIVERPVKRVKSVRGRQLVFSFTPFVYRGKPLCYSFQSFPIEELIHPSSASRQKKLKPLETFDWVESLDEPSDTDARTPHHFYISFLKVKEGDLVYAVSGGEDIWHACKDDHLDWGELPRNVNRISLSAPLENSQVESMAPMKKGKFYPLVVEIGGLIYALSRPFHDFSSEFLPCFEVYHPSEDNWLPLSVPPFFKTEFRDYYLMELKLFPYVVIGGKLHVSCGTHSCTYDPALNEWGPCYLFTKFPERFDIYLEDYKKVPECSPAFPFLQTPILLHQETILLSVDTIFEEYSVEEQLVELYYGSYTHEFYNDYEARKFIPPISAYRITDDKTEAEKIPIKLDKLPYGEFRQLIDLGNDHFAVLLYKADEEDQFCRKVHNSVTIATFKLELKCAEDGSLSSLEGKCISLLDCDSPCMPFYQVRDAFTME